MANIKSHLSPIQLMAIAIGMLLGSAVCLNAADSLQLGRAALADDLPAMAERHLISYLAANQSQPEKCTQAFLLLMQAVSDQGRPKDALALLDANPDIVSNAPPARIAYWEARSHLELGHATQAVAIVTANLPAAATAAASSRGNDSSDAVYDYGLLLRIEARSLSQMPGNEEKASEIFRKTDGILSDSRFTAMRPDNLYEWAHHEYTIENRRKAKEILAKLDALSPALTNAPSAPLEKGILLHASILLKDKQTSQAVVLLDSLATNTTATLANRAEAVLSLATIAANLERSSSTLATDQPESIKPPAEYLPLVEELTRELPEDFSWKINQRFGRILISARSSVSIGAGILAKSIRERPSAVESPSNQLAIADAWLSVSSNALAAAGYKAYLEAYHENSDATLAARLGQARALFRNGDYDEAATLFSQVAENSPDPNTRAKCLVQAAQALRSAEKYARSASLFLQAAQIPSTTNDVAWTFRAYFNAGDSLQNAGDLVDAERNFRIVSSAANAPADLANEALYRIALLHDRQGNSAAAIETYSALIEGASGNGWKAKALVGRGRNYYKMYKFAQAILDFDQIDKSNPEIAAEAAYYKLFCLYGTDRDTEAVQNAENFEKDFPGSRFYPSVVMWLAQYYYNEREYEKSQKTFTRYADLSPAPIDTPKALLWGATAAFERAEYQQAIDLLARLLKSFPDSDFAGEARFLQAKALCTLARFEDAILALDDVINRYPAAEFITDAWILYGDALFSSASSPSTKNRYKEAREAYAAARARCKTRKTGHGVIPADDDFSRYIESSFKIGRCLDKEGQLQQALGFLYDSVITPYLEAVQEGTFPEQEASTWFARAILQAADLLEHEGNYDGAIKVLGHLANHEKIAEHAQAEQMIRHLEAAKAARDE